MPTPGAAEIVAEGTAPLPTRIVLPASGRPPEGSGTGESARDPAGGAGGAGAAAAPVNDVETAAGWQQPWVGPYVQLGDERDRRAWFHFCHGHHVEFLYWSATTIVCNRAQQMADAGDVDGCSRAVDQLVPLVEGSAAMLSFCGAFDPHVYDPLLRASMERQRDDFSGDMATEFLVLATAKRDLIAALEAGGEPFAPALRRLNEAEHHWYRHHNVVVTTLHPGDSLLKVKVDELARRSAAFDFDAYVATVVHSDEARRDYDEYFGVTRDPDMTLELFWTQALEKVATVHRHFELPPDIRRRLVRGDAVLLSVISELLDVAPS